VGGLGQAPLRSGPWTGAAVVGGSRKRRCCRGPEEAPQRSGGSGKRRCRRGLGEAPLRSGARGSAASRAIWSTAQKNPPWGDWGFGGWTAVDGLGTRRGRRLGEAPRSTAWRGAAGHRHRHRQAGRGLAARRAGGRDRSCVGAATSALEPHDGVDGA
jgi:hypothetical protein